MTDRIVYTIVKNEMALYATFDRNDACKHIAEGSIKLEVIEDLEAVTNNILDNLPAVDLLLLEHYFTRRHLR